MDPTGFLLTVVLVLLLVFVVITVVRAVRIVPQASSLIVERLGRYSRTLEAGLHVLVPFIDRVRARVDLREQVVTFPPQPVITSDNLVVNIDTVIYFQPTDPRAAVYEIANYIQGIEQLTVTTLRNVIGSLDLEQTLTSRDQINGQLRGVLDEATGRWGIRVNRVELKAIDPPASVQDSMEQQMRAERNRRAAILTAEGSKQSQILTAEGEKQSAVLRAEGAAQAAILKAQGEARAIQQVFDAIHRGEPDPGLLAYMYLQTLPKLAEGQGNTTWVIPAELTEALRGIGAALGGRDGAPDAGWAAQVRPRRERPLGEPGTDVGDAFADTRLEDPTDALRAAREEVAGATREAERSTPETRAVAPQVARQAPEPPAAPTPPGPLAPPNSGY
ncbi:SPFH domain, Band 7 family protein [Quadrisphaera granulorum]|uniref:SPFH domain-containing protein n=1 Tax=Quadrisphaera granulorum TaxID=317664 RepID=A0A315ZYX7_9ACTN|nr:SPFH domain-containing protein [Quadrisphaera granulorum]PWJ50705.1 SPFH domain-containing protein [Quadrisphaera granulorum]SZE97953.1 SPFH domain, Band 7 family protein [Quadrisphaera granulorum]